MTTPDPSFAGVLAARRMCRDFSAEPIPPALLTEVLAAAFRGPAAGNTDSLDLVVLEGDDVGAYWDLTLPEPRRAAFRWPGLLSAPVLVIPYVDPSAYLARYAEPDKAHSGLGASTEDWTVPYWWVDGGAGVMALLLAAEAAGLGALLFGQFDHEPAVAELVGAPGGRRALGTVALGRPGPGPSRSASARRGRAGPAERIHRGAWRCDGAQEAGE